MDPPYRASLERLSGIAQRRFWRCCGGLGGGREAPAAESSGFRTDPEREPAGHGLHFGGRSGRFRPATRFVAGTGCVAEASRRPKPPSEQGGASGRLPDQIVGLGVRRGGGRRAGPSRGTWGTGSQAGSSTAPPAARVRAVRRASGIRRRCDVRRGGAVRMGRGASAASGAAPSRSSAHSSPKKKRSIASQHSLMRGLSGIRRT